MSPAGIHVGTVGGGGTVPTAWAWLLNADATAVAGTVYLWQDDQAWDDTHKWKG